AAVAVAEAAELPRVVADPAPDARPGRRGGGAAGLGLEVVGEADQQVNLFARGRGAALRRLDEVRDQPAVEAAPVHAQGDAEGGGREERGDNQKPGHACVPSSPLVLGGGATEYSVLSTQY